MRVDWRGYALDVRDRGNGPTIILLHGYPLDGAMWSGVARELSTRFRILKPDFPQRPENPVPAPQSLDGYVDFLEAILRALARPAGLAGFSMGGYVALGLMKRRPENVKALALVNTRASADEEAGKARRDQAIAEIRAHGASPVATEMVGRLLSPESLTQPDLIQQVRRIILRQKPEALESDLAAMRDRPDSTTFLGEITIPTLVVAGEHDAISTPEECRAMAAEIPGARLVTISGAGHLSPMEKPRAVASALGDFFGSVLAE